MAPKFLKRLKTKVANVFKRKPNKEFTGEEFNEKNLEVDMNETDFDQHHQIITSNKRSITSCFAAIRKRVSKKSKKNQNVNDENVCSEDSVPEVVSVPIYSPATDTVTPGTFAAKENDFDLVQKELTSRKLESDDEISSDDESSSGRDTAEIDDWREPKRPDSPSDFVPELTLISTENAALGEITLKIHDLGLEIEVGDQTYNCWEDVLTMDPEEPMIRSWSVQFPKEWDKANVLQSHFGSSPDIDVQNDRIGIKRKFSNFKRKMDHVVRQSLYNLEDAYVENNFFIDRNLLDLTKYFN